MSWLGPPSASSYVFRAVAKGFIELGLDPLHTVSVLGHNDPCLHMSKMGGIHAGGFATGMYLSSSPAACQYIAQDSRANILVAGDTQQLAKAGSCFDKPYSHKTSA